jgi:uracil-DNA glycosylase family 4
VAADVIACERCPRLRRYCLAVAREKVRRHRDEVYWGRPVPGFGDPRARLVLVGLAPAAHGGNRTGRVFTGDASGDWLFGALHEFGFASQSTSTGRDDGLTLTDCYVTASARCAPPGNKPTLEELRRCREYLVREIALLTRVRVVLPLGRVGFESYLKAAGHWDRMTPRERPVFGHGRETTLPDGTILLASFHPSRQNTQTGKLTRKMWRDIFRRARRHLGD